MLQRILIGTLAFACLTFGDTLTLKDGTTVSGTFVGGNSRQIRFAGAGGDRIESYDIGRVANVQFGADKPDGPPAYENRQPDSYSQQQRTNYPPQQRTEYPQGNSPQQQGTNYPARNDYPPNNSQQNNYPQQNNTEFSSSEIPSGTQIMIRMSDDVDSQRDRVGQTFRASTDEAVVVNGNTVIAKGSDVVVKLVDDKESGKLSGKTELTLDLASIQVNGNMVPVDSESITQSSANRGNRTAKVVGGTAALGAIIGAIAGGGKGAAIGAASGAAVGGAAEIATKGQRVRIPSETRLTFTLQHPVRL